MFNSLNFTTGKTKAPKSARVRKKTGSSSRQTANRGESDKETLTEMVQPNSSGKGNLLLAAGSSTLNLRFEPVMLAAGERLYEAGDVNEYVYFPETAVISHVCTLAEGYSLEIAMVGGEGASGLFSVFGSQPAPHEAIVTIAGTARRVKTQLLSRECLRANDLQKLLFGYAGTYLAEISQRVVCESFHLLEKRLCRWLLTLHDRVNDQQVLLTQEQIAQSLGINRPSLTLAAKKLRDQGLISYSRGKFFILDREKLKTAACECYSSNYPFQ